MHGGTRVKSKLLLAILVLNAACAQKKTTVVNGGSSAQDRVTFANCMEPNKATCKTISYITQSSTTPTADAAYQLGVYDAFANGVGLTLSCDLATSEAECSEDARAFLIDACDNEVDTAPPIYARKYANPSMGFVHIQFQGRTLNFAFTEIICQLNQSRIN